MKKLPKFEWSFPIEVETLGATPAQYNITADEDACASLAERFDVLGLENVKAAMTLTRERGGLVIHVKGRVMADIRQSCVVTLEPMQSHIEDEFEAFYADRREAVSFAQARADIRAKKGEVEVEMIDERDAPEEIVNGRIDLGEVAAQFLSLAINPYPRSDAAGDLPHEPASDAHDDNATSPFAAALKEWKDGLK